MTLEQYEQTIDALAAGAGDPGERCERLSAISAEIRRCLWSPPYQAAARRLAARADAEAVRIGSAHRLVVSAPLPRFPAFVDGAGNLYTAID